MTQQEVSKLKEKALPILRQAGVTRSSVFGSYAEGKKKVGDIDILVDFPRGKTLLDLVSLQRKLEEALGKKVDLLTYQSISPLLKEKILGQQIQIL